MRAQYDKHPCVGEGVIKEHTSGFYLHNANNITLRNCRITWGMNKPDYFGHDLTPKHVSDLKIKNFHGEVAFPDRDESMSIN